MCSIERRSFKKTLSDHNYPKPPHFRHKPALYENGAEQIELILGTKASLGLSYTVLEGNSGIFKNKGTSL